MPTLSVQQKRRFKRDGFLILRDAMDNGLIADARELLWEAIPAERDDPASWFARDGDHEEILRREAATDSGENLRSVEPFEQLFRDVYPYAEALVGEDVLAPPEGRPMEHCLHAGHLMASREDGTTVVDHDGALGPILQYPTDIADPLEKPFDYTEARHVDGGTGPYALGTDRVYLPFTIACAVYFDEVEPRGGGFTVWPGSHRIMEEYFQDHTRQDYQETPNLLENLDPGPGMEITGGPGTLVLWHHNIMHAAAPNHSERIRMAGFQRIARKDIAEIEQRGLSDIWLQYPEIRDLEPIYHDPY